MKLFVSVMCLLLAVAQIGFLMVADVDALRTKLSLNPSDREFDSSTTPESVELKEARNSEAPGRVTPNQRATLAQSSRESEGDGSLRTERVSRASVRILDGTLAQTKGSGMGTVLAIHEGSFDVLSADHVIEGIETIAVEWLLWNDVTETSSIVRAAARPLHRDRNLDLCLLRVFSDAPPPESLDLADKTIHTTTKSALIVDGTAGAFDVSIVQRPTEKIAKRATGARPIKYWIIETPLKPGMSGSAVANGDGQLLGVASGNSDRFAYYVHHENLIEFLASWQEPRSF